MNSLQPIILNRWIGFLHLFKLFLMVQWKKYRRKLREQNDQDLRIQKDGPSASRERLVTDMLYFWDIEKIIKNTLHDLNLNLNVEISNNLNAPMNYNVSTNTIKFNYLKINGYNAQINFKIKETDENFVKIMLYHELGYYLDFKKNKRDLKILLYGEDKEKEQLMSEIETNAWEYGRTLVPKHLVKSYDLMHELDKLLIKA